jgi:outer membrane protein OmpA-like peptidoglycan-associated protein
MLKHLLLLPVLVAALSLYGQTYKVEEVTIECTTYSIKGINSNYDDFSPSVVNNQLIFTSGRETDLVHAGENNWKRTGYLNLFVTELKKGWSDTSSYKNVEPYSETIKTTNHTGPASFTPTGDTIFFTQVAPKKRKQKTDRKPQLYMAGKVNSNWENITALPFNHPEFSFGHPAWDPQTSTLYFSSDFEGGKGGKDIYRSKFSGGTWGPIENVAEVNTEYDEMFPAIASGDLFFSSNRPGGAGGMDIFWKVLGTEQEIKNLESLNTAYDEIGIYVSPDRTKGFYSSNANGNDDISFFYMERSVTVSNELAGQFTYRNLDGVSSGLQVQLFSEEGELLFEQTTDANGEFTFRNLPGENYTIKALSEDDLELVVYDAQGEATTYLLRDSQGAFQYKKIDYSDAGTLGLIDDSMIDFQLKQGWISGQFTYENFPGKYADSLMVMLVDENGNTAFTQMTDQHGNFDFRNLSLIENYILTTEDIDENLVLFIFDQDGNVVAQLKQNESGGFVYRKIKSDYATNLQALAEDEDVFEYNTMTLTGNFDYKSLEGDFKGGLEVMLYDEQGIYITSTTTNERGEFRFTSLDPTISYLFAINEENLPFEMTEFNLEVINRHGEVVAELERGSAGFFTYKKLGTVSAGTLAVLDETEVKFNFDHKQSVIIFFEKNSSYPANEDYQLLSGLITHLKNNPSSKIHISAYADSRAPSEYNTYLSEKRANRIKDYIVRRGIAPDRIVVQAYGETKLVNNCGDGIECPEEEHARNRRVEVLLAQ